MILLERDSQKLVWRCVPSFRYNISIG